MPRVTQPTEYPGKYDEKFEAIKKQMMKKMVGKKWTEKQIEVMIKSSLIREAKDKIEFSLNGQIRRGVPAKKGMPEDEFEREWRSAMRKRLESDGYPFSLTADEKKIEAEIIEKRQMEATKEITETTAAALKKILTSV